MAQVKTILVPVENEKDVAEIDEEIKDGLEIILVKTMDEVVKYAFV